MKEEEKQSSYERFYVYLTTVYKSSIKYCCFPVLRKYVITGS